MRHLALLLVLSSLATGCVRTLAISVAADALAGSGGSFASDNDPELVREALPFGLKTIESFIEAAPDNRKLLLAAASGFTQYAYAFIQQDAERFDETDPPRSRHLLARARKLYARARAYGLRGLEVEEEGFNETFARDRKAALAGLDREAVPLLYWTAAAWAAEIAISKNDANLLGDMPRMEALMDRALALDEAFGEGTIHEFYVSYDGGRDESVGGSLERAKAHFARAVALSKGEKLGPYVAWAESVSVRKQQKKRFLELLDRVIAFDVDRAPRFRLANLIAQDRARRLKARVDDLFAD